MATDLATVSGALTGDATARAAASIWRAGRAAGMRVPAWRGVGAGDAVMCRDVAPQSWATTRATAAHWDTGIGRDAALGGFMGKTITGADHKFD